MSAAIDSEQALTAPVATLFPDREQRARLDDLLTRELIAAHARVLAGSVTPTLDLARFHQELAAFDFQTPLPMERLIGWTIAQLEQGVVHMTHPRYFGLFNPAANFPAQCADRISGAFNPQLASSGSSPAPVAIEAHVIGAVARRAGLPEPRGGHFTTAGSEANYTAVVCALTRADARYGIGGVRAFSGPPVIYASRESQPGWFKIAHQAGIGRAALRLIGTDGQGRMDPAALQEAIGQDRSRGAVPILVAATAGTTGAGMIDPLRACAALARAQGLWYHVDAAWGGAALCSERMRGLLDGIELADSVTVDAHKWFATTMGCGMFLTRHPAILSEAFRVSTDFMPSSVVSLDPYLNTAQWSRRFLGLRLFLSLAAAGWSGYGAHVERAVGVIGRIERRLRACGWQIANQSELAVLCAIPPAGSIPVRDVARQVLASGRAWVAVTTFESREVLRICATHGEISQADVEILVAALEAARARV